MQRNADIGRPTIQRIKAMSLKTRKTTLSRKKKKNTLLRNDGDRGEPKQQ